MKYDPNNRLEPGTVWAVSRATVVSPDPDPEMPLVAMAGMRTIIKGKAFKVLSNWREARGKLWYGVETSLGRGWINEIGLMGQDLERIDDGQEAVRDA
jgi:hypothetical protein